MPMDTLTQPAVAGAPSATSQLAAKLAMPTETFWRRADRIGSYIFATLFLMVGFGLPLTLLVYSFIR